MFEKVIDAFCAIIFTGVVLFGATVTYNLVRRKALLQVQKGLSSTYRFSRVLSGTHYSWEDQKPEK